MQNKHVKGSPDRRKLKTYKFHPPMITFSNWLWPPSPFQKIDLEVRKEIDEAVAKARSDAELPLKDLYTNIYSQIPDGYEVRGTSAYNWHPTA